MSRAHSVEELLNTPPEPDKPSSSSQPRPHGSSKGIDSKVDWKVFQEAVSQSQRFFYSEIVKYYYHFHNARDNHVFDTCSKGNLRASIWEQYQWVS